MPAFVPLLPEQEGGADGEEDDADDARPVEGAAVEAEEAVAVDRRSHLYRSALPN